MARTLSLPSFLDFRKINLPPALRIFLKPMLLASLGVHAIVLLTPLPSPPVKVVSPKPKTLKVTALPPISKAPKSLSTPRLSPRVTPPQVAAIPQKGLTISRPAQKRSAAVAPPQPAPKNQPVPSAQPTPGSSEPAPDPNNPMGDFPHYPGAIPGCLDVPSCYGTGKPLDTVAQYFQKQLPLKKFEVQQTVKDADRKVFQITKGGQTQFLSVLLTTGNIAVYVLAPEPRTLDDLKKTVQVPADFTETIMGKLPAGTEANQTNVTPEQLTNPQAFFTQLGGQDAQGFDIAPVTSPEVESIKFVAGQTPEQVFSSYFSSSLTQLSYKATPIASGYEGGPLYEIKKGSTKPFYLNLVPAKGGGGTVVVVWLSKPS